MAPRGNPLTSPQANNVACKDLIHGASDIGFSEEEIRHLSRVYEQAFAVNQALVPETTPSVREDEKTEEQ